MLHGEMPMRDFMAYDIGRYAWTAIVMHLLGDSGIVGARIGAALFQCCTLVVGVLVVLRTADRNVSSASKVLFASVVAVTLNLWAYPYYKVFDYGTSILIVAMLVLMLTSQSPRHWFGAGVILGLSAIMGRNHGVYGAFAALMLMCFLLAKKHSLQALVRPSCAFIAGTIVGFSPTFALFALVDGFATGFIASVLDLINSGATNIGLPVPWPWTIDRAKFGWVLWAIGVSTGLGFIAIILLPVVAVITLVRRAGTSGQPIDVLILCSSFVSIIYAHYAYSRADLTHLALSIAPLLLLVLSAGARYAGITVTSIAVLGMSLLTLAPEKSFLTQLLLQKPLAAISVNNSTLYVFQSTAFQLREAERVLATIPHASDSFLALPNTPGLYAIYEKKMPIWEIYSLWPRNAAFENAELARLKAAAPNVVLLSDHALDERPEFRYSKTHPVLYRWIKDNYRPSSEFSSATSFQVLVK